MVGNYYTLLAVAGSLSELLPGKALGVVFSQDRDELVVGFEGFGPVLVVCCRAGETTCFLHPRFARARRNSVELMPEARGRIIDRVWLEASDRVLALSCRDGSRLMFQLYSPHANALLVDRDGNILDAFKRASKLRGTPLELRSGSAVVEPVALRDHLAASAGSALLHALKRWMPELGPILTQELLDRAGLEGTIPAEEPDRTQIARLEHEVENLREEIQEPHPHVYLGAGNDAVRLSLVSLGHLKGKETRHFEEIHEAIRFTLYRRRAAKAFLLRQRELLHHLRQVADRATRSLQRMRADQKRTRREEGYSLFGELLLTHLHEIPEGADLVTLPHSGGPQRIPLDPSISVARNAQRYFEKARVARHGAEAAVRRAASLERRAGLATAMIEEVETCRDRDQLEELMRARRTAADALGLGSREADRADVPFRVFTVEGGFEVWAGKNSANNDLLTLRYARPKDLWFHARGSGGSHVILRTGSAPGEPPKRAKEQAAAIAAYYSKMRRASLVPVTVTEKKYVRKVRGAPAGTVHVERESVLFAAPALPVQSHTTSTE